MKRPDFTFHLAIVSITIAMFLTSKSYGQLNGSYTINPTSAASSSNYRNWASAVGDLLNGSRTDGGSAQGPGVNGPVEITVYDTIYSSTSIELTAITGASYTNTVTFKSAGGDSSKCILSNTTSASATNNYVLYLNGVDYVTFQEIGMERLGNNTFHNVVVIANDADKNKLIRCFLKGKKNPSNSTNGFVFGVGSIIYFKGNADSTEITQNRIMYGYNGVYDTVASTDITISGNIFDTSGSSGIYMTSQTALRILGNKFNMGDFGAGKGHYTSYGFRIETSPSLIAANNNIIMSAVNGQVVRAIVIAGVSSPSSAPAMIYNNMIVNGAGTTECTGFAVYGTYYLNILNNNVLITSSLGNASAYYHYAAYTNSNIRILNNNLINKGGGYALNVPGTNTGDIDSLDYNNIFSNGKYLGNWNATNYSTFSSWKSGTGRDGNSMNFDPGYTSNSNLHVSNVKLNGRALYDSRIRTDIDGDSRDNSTPDIGADEFFPGNIDIGVTNLDSPLIFSPGKQNVKVSFQNYGFDTITTAHIQWQINGSSQTPYSWSGKVAPGESSASITLGNYTFSTNTAYSFKIWTRIPNNISDEKNSNDTLKLTRMPAMTGSYTIGDTSVADFKSFNQAITAMTSRGVCAATNFSVFKGLYTEQLTIVQLPGMGAANPIKFTNVTNDSTQVTIRLSATTATGSNNAALQLRGASYVTFKGITFERTGSSTNIGHVIHILNGANHNTFINCQMLGLFNGSANGYNIWSDGSKDDYNTFRNNYVRYGNTSMQYLGDASREVGTVIEGNIFEGALNNSVFLQYNDSATVKGNYFMNINTHIAGNYSLQLNDCDKGINVNGNFFKSVNSDTSIWLNGCNGKTKSRGIVANNSIVRGYGKAIVLDAIDSQNVVFNSIYFNSNSPDNTAIYASSAASNDIVLKNNNIVMLGGSVFYINNPSHIGASDFNNLNTKGTQFAYWGASVSNLPGLVFISGKDGKSMNVDPLFTSANLHIKNYLLKGKAQPIAGVTTDFDGQIRSNTTPDIGADEFELSPDDAGIIAVIQPVALTCAGLLDVSAVIKNFGKDTLRSAEISWSVNGTAQANYSWSGKLATFATDTVVIGNYNFATAFNPRFIVKTNLPNGNTDGLRFNDSVIINRTLRGLPAANAGQDITICFGDSIVIGSGASTGLSYRWTNISNVEIGTTSEITVKPTSKTIYILEVTSLTFGCVNKDSIEVDVSTKPNADAGSDKTICPGNTSQLGSTTQNGFSYNWTSIPSGFTSSISDPTVKPTQSTTYILEKSITGSGCADMDTVVIKLASVPAPIISGKGEVCQDERLIYTTQLIAGNTYKWLINGGTIIGGQNTNSINIKWNTPGIGILNVIETNAQTCFDTTIFYATINPNPAADFNIINTCLNSLTSFKNTSTGGQTYSWTFGDGSSSSVKDPTHTYAEAISYNVTLIVKNIEGCPDTVTKLLPIDPLPIANFTYTQKPSNTIDFTNTSTVSSGTLSSYSWKFGDGTDSSILKDPSHIFPNSANYFVTLCVKSAAGCETCTTKVVGFTGIKSQVSTGGIKIYPNPGTGNYIIISGGKMVSINVSNTLGQIIKTEAPLAKEFKLDMTVQPNGVYFVKIDLSGQVQTLKIVKE